MILNNDLPSDKEKHSAKYVFAICFFPRTRLRHSLRSVFLTLDKEAALLSVLFLHSANHFALGKELVSGSAKMQINLRLLLVSMYVAKRVVNIFHFCWAAKPN